MPMHQELTDALEDGSVHCGAVLRFFGTLFSSIFCVQHVDLVFRE